MKRTSSSNGVIKSGIEAEAFAFPVQTPSLVRRPAPRPEAPENKAEEVPKEPPGPTPEELALSEANSIVEEARTRAGQILKEAEDKAEEILAEALEAARQIEKEAAADGQKNGYAAGREKGLKEGREQLENALKEQQAVFEESLQRALRSVDKAKEQNLKAYLDELKDCALAVAEKVIYISLKSSGEVIKRMLISETEKLKKTAWVKIYMEKTNYNMMMEADADVVNELARLSDNIKFVVMNKENSGNCIIEMPEEIVDISVDTQMENIRDLLENIKI